MFTIYLITNLVNGKYYVGQTVMSLRERFNAHAASSYRGERWPLAHAFRKYGRDAFEIQALAEVGAKEEADNLERLNN